MLGERLVCWRNLYSKSKCEGSMARLGYSRWYSYLRLLQKPAVEFAWLIALIGVFKITKQLVRDVTSRPWH